jgi:uroporphyrinogen III methyltransferase/synthase
MKRELLALGGQPAEPGMVYLVGAGPGDPGLLSLRAAVLLRTATVVAYDRLAPAEALRLCQPEARLVYVGKSPQRHALSQGEINELLVTTATEGEAVVRLKGGDPFVFGRGSEEALACRAAGIGYEVVPGVTSAVAGPAYAGVPVTHRGLAPAFAVVTGHEDPTKDETQVDYAALAAFPGTLVLLMGVGRIGAIADALRAAGRSGSTPVAVVQWASTPRQRTLVATLETVAERLAEAGLVSPAVIVVGEVAALHDELAWFEGPQGEGERERAGGRGSAGEGERERAGGRGSAGEGERERAGGRGSSSNDWVTQRRPLHGLRVLVPRTRHQASELSSRLRALGADPVEAPTIAIEPTREPGALRRRIEEVANGAFDWVALTSVNGVAAVWEHVTATGGDARTLAGVRIAAVGSGTAQALSDHGLRADLLPERYTTRGLADALLATGAPGRVLLPRADIATATLVELLRDASWDVVEVEAYRTVPVTELDPGVADQVRHGGLDVVAFASSSTVRNLVELLGGPPHADTRVASIGPVTSDTCRQLGLRVDAEAEPHDVDGLVRAVVAAVAPAAVG